MRQCGINGRIVILRNRGYSFRKIGDLVGISGNYARVLFLKSKGKKEEAK